MLIPEKKEYKEMSFNNLLSIVDNPPTLVEKVHAIISLVKNYSNKSTCLAKIIQVLKDKENINTRFLGNISISLIGVVAMIELENENLKTVIIDIIKGLPPQEMQDFIWYLDAEGIIGKGKYIQLEDVKINDK